jgi:sphinganine-1-phosphate aldolase
MDEQGAAQKLALPKVGVPRREVLDKMVEWKQADARWHEGRTFSLVYHQSDEHTAFLKEAFSLFFSENALNPAAFSSLKRFENEVVAMVAELLHGDVATTGTMTSGGTESLFLALKTYRDRSRAQHPEIRVPEVILPITAHPAFDKAAQCLDVKLVPVPTDEHFRAELSAVKAALSANTILLVGSAPAYPQGVIDPIAELAAIAKERGIGMHVDACLGGFLLPFLDEIGDKVPPFDFALPGVTSMSADLHKYGFTAKGASTILYRSAELRKYQFSVRSDWPGGLWGSTTLAGTRPGGPIACAWATLLSMGRDGYVRSAATIMETTRKLQQGIAGIDGLRIFGAPEMSVFCFGSPQGEPRGVNIFAVADAMEARGWHIDRQHRPNSIHLMITPAHAPIVEAYLADLRSCVEAVRQNPSLAEEGQAAAYGLITRLPEQGMARELILQHMSDLYKV